MTKISVFSAVTTVLDTDEGDGYIEAEESAPDASKVPIPQVTQAGGMHW